MTQQPIFLNGTHSIQQIQQFLSQNANLQVVRQPQLDQQTPQYIVNRQIVANVPKQEIIQQTRFWLLVELENNNEQNSYIMVESSEVIGNNNDISNLHTGKCIKITYNNRIRMATVVIVSDDKNFILAELQQLKQMSEENLREKEAPSKKRRLDSSEMCRKDLEDDQSSVSAWSVVSQANANGTDRTISPTPTVQSNRMRQGSQKYIPPMTFDQQTQTDFRNEGNIDFCKLVKLNELLLDDQKQMKKENQADRELLAQEMGNIQKMLENIESRLNAQQEVKQIIQNPLDASGSKIFSHQKMLNNGQVFDNNTIQYIVSGQQNGTNGSSLSLNGSEGNYVITEEIIEQQDDQNTSSRFSFHDQNTMMSTISTHSDKKTPLKRSKSGLSLNSTNGSSSTPIIHRSNQSLMEQVQRDWSFDASDGDEKVVIGTNKTEVPAHVLRSIKWDSYKSATRKLLITLFSRDMLATHSLTGRPSPAFADRKVKDKLDQNMIQDIIQIVTRNCGVAESLVRTAITTKLADENKMMRQRNKQTTSPLASLNSSAIGNGLDNKENIEAKRS